MNRHLKRYAQAIHASRISALALLCALASPAVAGCDLARFTAEGAEVRDDAGKLIWRRCSLGQDWREGEGCVGRIRGLTLGDAKAAAAAEPGWRLPTADELLSLVDIACGTPSIDARVFPNVPIDPGGDGTLYWTATPAGMLGMTITIDFRDGTYDMHSPGLAYFVRPVRSAK